MQVCPPSMQRQKQLRSLCFLRSELQVRINGFNLTLFYVKFLSELQLTNALVTTDTLAMDSFVHLNATVTTFRSCAIPMRTVHRLWAGGNAFAIKVSVETLLSKFSANRSRWKINLFKRQQRIWFRIWSSRIHLL